MPNFGKAKAEIRPAGAGLAQPRDGACLQSLLVSWRR